MQVSVEHTGALERRMQVEIPEERIAERVQARLREVAQTAKLDGFRAGKIPAKVVERRFGTRVRKEVVAELLQSTFGEALTSEDLNPAGPPTIEDVHADQGNGLTYKAKFEVYPEVQLADMATLVVETPHCEIEEADVDNVIEKLREQHKTWQAVTRSAQSGDRLTLDFEGRIDGEKFAGGEAQDFELELGTGLMIPGFEDGLLGASVDDERLIETQFPEAYGNAELAGKSAAFTVQVKAIAAPQLPALEADFFAQFGVQEGDLAAFRAEVRTNMERERNRALAQRSKQGVLTSVAAAHDFVIPTALVDAEIERLQEQTVQQAAMRGVARDQLGELPAAAYENRARERVKLGLLLAEIIKTADLKANPSKVRAMIESLAEGYEEPDALVNWYYSEQSRLQEIEAACVEEDAVAWIVAQAQQQAATVSFDDLVNPRQTED